VLIIQFHFELLQKALLPHILLLEPIDHTIAGNDKDGLNKALAVVFGNQVHDRPLDP
jgi:hypothetical protein